MVPYGSLENTMIGISQMKISRILIEKKSRKIPGILEVKTCFVVDNNKKKIMKKLWGWPLKSLFNLG